MKFVAILCLAFLGASGQTCVAWVCDPSGDKWDDNVCAMQHGTNTTQWDLRTGYCKSDQYCPVIGGVVIAGISVNCTNNVAPSAQAVAYPGEPCDSMHTCVQGTGQGTVAVTCTSGTCSSVPTTCVNVQDCGLGKTCNAGTCTNLAAVGAACTYDTDCVLGAGCDIAVGGTGKCVTYNSVAAGGAVQTCGGANPTTQLQSHPLCASGYCYETGGKYACSGTVTSNGTPPLRCQSSTSTCTSNKDSFGNLTAVSNCECGLDGYSYCPLFPGDKEYSNYLSDLNSLIASSTLSKCNTARHMPSFTYASNYAWCAQNMTDTQTYNYLRATEYTTVVMAKDCVLKMVVPDYYKVEGGAGYLALGGLLLALLQ